jgi:hypothetical protein
VSSIWTAFIQSHHQTQLIYNDIDYLPLILIFREIYTITNIHFILKKKVFLYVLDTFKPGPVIVISLKQGLIIGVYVRLFSYTAL